MSRKDSKCLKCEHHANTPEEIMKYCMKCIVFVKKLDKTERKEVQE